MRYAEILLVEDNADDEALALHALATAGVGASHVATTASLTVIARNARARRCR